MTLLLEYWKPVVGFEDLYQVSNTGRVIRIGRGSGAKFGRPIKSYPVDRSKLDGYLQINLWRNGKINHRLVHRVVAEAFIGPYPSDMEVNHKDTRQRNCYAGNLEYLTRNQNMLHALDASVRRGGIRAKSAKLTKEEVLVIAGQRRSVDALSIATSYGMSKAAIDDIFSSKRWGWLTGIGAKP